MVDKNALLDMEQLVIAEYCENKGIDEENIGPGMMEILLDAAYERVIEGWATRMDYMRDLERDRRL
ncbi:hypothetical protein UFOVP1292_49 [uncultured Caudovirales phage]|uniref:Uncharacterized protein n=1 Tax=uncultured Caudovirales phage TaxID=2100421 RepID=A0A6J5PAI5_9CAUD|nr:hypothetical protein UFOVP859_46 [uncultured Caudovirales phage]CAB4168513.1 hypothetical protein UFOVP882_44 [uncultured Caudovirales phage]CAB4196445.1 hypothetical protein UFOVP1292_49 [uncultured Caudovirales phage]CAB4205197.1 hypothetical protein UFOVP1411_40 [uncultured Caudovirales phage]